MTACNEGITIGEIIDKYIQICEVIGIDEYEFVIINNGSTDNTSMEVIRRIQRDLYKVNYQFHINKTMKPYVEVYNDLFKYAKGDYVFITDADGQYEPLDFLTLWMYKDACQIVTGFKYKRADPFFKILQSKVFHTLTTIIMRAYFEDPDCGFRLYSRKAINDIGELSILPYSPGTEAIYKSWAKNNSTALIPIRHYKRKYGKSKVTSIDSIFNMVKQQLRGLVKLYVSCN